MTVVINEFEIVPAQDSDQQQSAPPPPAPETPAREIRRLLSQQAERLLRVRAH